MKKIRKGDGIEKASVEGGTVARIGKGKREREREERPLAWSLSRSYLGRVRSSRRDASTGPTNG